MKVVRANQIDDDMQKQISNIFVDGFYQWLKFFSKDKQKLANALEHIEVVPNKISISDRKPLLKGDMQNE